MEERHTSLFRRGTLRRRRARKLSVYAKKLGLEVVFTPVPSPREANPGALPTPPPSSSTKAGVVEVGAAVTLPKGCCVLMC